MDVDDCSLVALPTSLTAAYAVSLGVFVLAFGVWVLLYACCRVSRARRNEVALSLVFGIILFLLQVFLYVALLLGQGAYFDPRVGVCVPWARWLVYTFSCALLAYEIARATRMEVATALLFVAMISFTLLLGAFSAASTTETDRWVWYGVACVPYLVALYLLWLTRHCGILYFVLITWTIYPIVYGLSVALGGVISLTVESWLYLAADLVTKIAFEAWILARVMSA